MARMRAFAAAFLTVAVPASANGGPSSDWSGHMWGGGGYGMVFGLLFMIIVIAAVVAVVVLMVRWLGGPGHGPGTASGGRNAQDILRERYARGEIDAAEFEERKRLLEG